MADVIAMFFLILVIAMPSYVLREFLERRHEKKRPKTDDERFLESIHVRHD